MASQSGAAGVVGSVVVTVGEATGIVDGTSLGVSLGTSLGDLLTELGAITGALVTTDGDRVPKTGDLEFGAVVGMRVLTEISEGTSLGTSLGLSLTELGEGNGAVVTTEGALVPATGATEATVGGDDAGDFVPIGAAVDSPLESSKRTV
jgi:hypothetical protein